MAMPSDPTKEVTSGSCQRNLRWRSHESGVKPPPLVVDSPIRADSLLGNGIWGPVGRFGWKYHNLRGETNPLEDILKEAKEMGELWPPFKSGIFGKDIALFLQVADEYRARIAKRALV